MGPSDVLGIGWGALGASLWALGTVLEVLGGSLGGPWGSWSCSCEALGGPWGILGEILGVLERSLAVLGVSLATLWVTLWDTKCPKRYAHRCFSVYVSVRIWDVLGGAGGILGASWWALGTSLGPLGGSMWIPCRSLAALGISLGNLDGFFEVCGGSLATPCATLWGTKCPRRYAQRCFSVSWVLLIYLNLLKFPLHFHHVLYFQIYSKM